MCLLVSSLLVGMVGCGTKQSPISSTTHDATQYVPPALDWQDVGVGIRGAQLPKRAGGESDKRFDSLSVERTGLDFAHEWEPPADYKLKIYNSLPGGGVSIGDVDGDRLPDVYLTQPHVGSRLYRNLGEFRFEDVTESSGLGENPQGQGATLVDVDNDGDLDLFVCNSQRPNNLFINDGRGRFVDQAERAGLDFSGASVMVAFADYDRDGDLDAYLVTNRVDPAQPVPGPKQMADGSFQIPEPHREFVDVIVDSDGRPRVVKAAQYDHLYRNNGDGTFSDVSDQAGLVGAYWGLSANWWDFDRDGLIDVYVSNDFYSPDQLYRNNGDGTFTDVAPSALPHTPWYSMGSDVADINNDGLFDLMASDMSGTSHYKQKASMGDMSTTSWFLTHPTPRQYMRNALYLNTGTSRFMEVAQQAGVANTDWTWSLKFADLDEDGWVDLYVTNGMNRDWTNSDLRNASNQAKTGEEKMRVWVESPQRRDPNLAFRNNRDLHFEVMDDSWGLGEERVSYGAAFGDLDCDGDLDLIVNNAEEAPSVYRNQSHGSHRIALKLEGTGNNRNGFGAVVSVKTADGQQWRQLTNSQGFMASNEPSIHFGLGDCPTIERLEVVWPDGRKQAYDNLPSDFVYVIRESDTTAVAEIESPPALYQSSTALAGVRHEETPFNDFARQPLLPNQLSQLGPGMAWGDVDADGDADLYLSGASGQAGQLMIDDGQGNFELRREVPWSLDSACEDMAPLFFDCDGDDDLDLYVVSGGVECEPGDEVLQDRLYLNDGNGNFTNAPDDCLPDIRESGSVVAAADFDRDGDLDLFVGGRVIPGQYPLSPRSVLLQNQGGRFADATDEMAPELSNIGLVTSAVWSDSNRDGWIDLLVTSEWGPVALLSNQNGKLVRNKTAFVDKSGWHNSIIAVDVDRDGDQDYVVGNHGWNSKYHASTEKPTLLYYGDFEKSGRMRLVEAEYEDETLFPVRGKSCSTNAMPFLGDKFERFHDFAIASLDEIYTEKRISSAHRFAANSLTSGVWMNDGDDQFRFLPLPTLCQAAPIFGMVACDANGDAIPDLFVAQNFFGPQAETGRADGGVSLVLIGQGDGTFVTMSPRESGVVVSGDATAVCQVDLDADRVPELCVATNDGPLHVFRRQADRSGETATVELVGPAGNRAAIGARVEAQFANDQIQTAEIVAGGGYLSQSATGVSFGLDDSSELKAIRVFWPDGTTSSVSVNETNAPIRVLFDSNHLAGKSG